MKKALASEIIDRMVRAAKATGPTDMLKIIGFADGLASKWKKNNEVPDQSVALVAVKTGYSFEWLLTGDGDECGAQVYHPVPEIRERMATYGEMEQRLCAAWLVAGEEAKEGALLILENSARRSPGKGGRECDLTAKRSA